MAENQTASTAPQPQKFVVIVDDNYNYMDEDERYTLGEFETAEEAIAAAQRIVDQFLERGLCPGSTPESLFTAYAQYGEDPHIPGVYFNAWDYARQRCAELCAKSSGRS